MHAPPITRRSDEQLSIQQAPLCFNISPGTGKGLGELREGGSGNLPIISGGPCLPSRGSLCHPTVYPTGSSGAKRCCDHNQAGQRVPFSLMPVSFVPFRDPPPCCPPLLWTTMFAFMQGAP